MSGWFNIDTYLKNKQAKEADMRENLAEIYGDDLLFADGFDEALIGVATRCGMDLVALYDIEKCVDILVGRDKMTHEEALEYFEYNVLGSYVGDKTPIFSYIVSQD